MTRLQKRIKEYNSSVEKKGRGKSHRGLCFQRWRGKSKWLSTEAPNDILTIQILKASKGKNLMAQHTIHMCKEWPLHCQAPEEIRQFLDALLQAQLWLKKSPQTAN